jgi:hypothetical protein
MTKGMCMSLIGQSRFARAALLPALMAGLSLFWIALVLLVARLD